MVNTAPDYPFERIVEVVSSIPNKQDRVYAELLFCLACREGEIVPYVHYKHKYSKQTDEEPNKLLDKKQIACSYGINVDDVYFTGDFIGFNKIPVFKTKNLSESKAGFIFKKNNPFFYDILTWVQKRKAIRENKKGEGNITPVYLFDVPVQGVEDIQRDFWARRKRLERQLKKADKLFRPHSLRKSRATIAGNISGDVFYVRDLLGHKSIEMSSRYVAKKKLFDSIQKYEVDNEEEF